MAEDCYGLCWPPALAEGVRRLERDSRGCWFGGAAVERAEFERFARGLRRRTQARLRFCSHRSWRWDRDECAGCGWTSFELLAAGEIPPVAELSVSLSPDPRLSHAIISGVSN